MKQIKRLWIYPVVLIGCVSVIINSCKKDDTKDEETPTPTVQAPSVTTSIISSVTVSTASCGGNVTADGGTSVTAKGVCWSTNQTPTIADSKTSDGTGTGSFTSSLTGLNSNTTYYVRAYATNSAGTGYGSILSFSTSQIVTDVDGNEYHTVNIGTQVWLVENLKTTKYRNGDPLPIVTNNTSWSTLTTGAYCNYNNDVANSSLYGYLYNWFAVNDGRKIAPTGWHIPSDAEWTTLTTYLGGENVASGKLKEAGLSHWASPNTGATDETGFTALPGGYRDNNGVFYFIGNAGYWWSYTENLTNYAWYRTMYSYSAAVTRNYCYKVYGNSVRCIKD
jgi:uncharacterized protein (TIGR02145 family)